MCDLELRRLELRGRHPLAERNLEDADEVLEQAQLGAGSRPRHAEPHARVEHRVREESRLHEVRLRDAEPLVRGLHGRVVEQGLLHRRDVEQRGLYRGVGEQRLHQRRVGEEGLLHGRVVE